MCSARSARRASAWPSVSWTSSLPRSSKPPPPPALEFTANVCSELELERWLGEPVKCLVIPTSIFLTNAKGFPVLSKLHQAYFRRFFKVGWAWRI